MPEADVERGPRLKTDTPEGILCSRTCWDGSELMVSKRVLWVGAAVLAVLIGLLLFRPAAQPEPGSSGSGTTIATSGIPVLVEFYTDT